MITIGRMFILMYICNNKMQLKPLILLMNTGYKTQDFRLMFLCLNKNPATKGNKNRSRR